MDWEAPLPSAEARAPWESGSVPLPGGVAGGAARCPCARAGPLTATRFPVPPGLAPLGVEGPAHLACRLVVPSLSLSSSCLSAAFPGPWGSHVSHSGLTEGNHLPSVQVHTGTVATRTGTSEVRWVHSLPGGRRRLPCVPGAPPVGVALGLGGREGLGRQPWVFTLNTEPG